MQKCLFFLRGLGAHNDPLHVKKLQKYLESFDIEFKADIFVVGGY